MSPTKQPFFVERVDSLVKSTEKGQHLTLVQIATRCFGKRKKNDDLDQFGRDELNKKKGLGQSWRI